MEIDQKSVLNNKIHLIETMMPLIRVTYNLLEHC